ncbi:unnamed protein product, partial [Callosobruchus maculatus]
KVRRYQTHAAPAPVREQLEVAQFVAVGFLWTMSSNSPDSAWKSEGDELCLNHM